MLANDIVSSIHAEIMSTPDKVKAPAYQLRHIKGPRG